MMPLTFWIVLWKVVLIGGVGMFAVLAIVVTIGGARDVVALLHGLQATSETKDESHSGDE